MTRAQVSTNGSSAETKIKEAAKEAVLTLALPTGN